MNKLLLSFLLTTLLLVNCSVNRSKESAIVINAGIIEKPDKDLFKDISGTFYSLHIEIVNNTDSVFRFWTMSCSWQVNWVFSNENLHLFNYGCDSNYPMIIEILPGNAITYDGIIRIQGELGHDTIYNTRLGLICIKEKEVNSLEDFHKVLEEKFNTKQGIIWSSPFRVAN